MLVVYSFIVNVYVNGALQGLSDEYTVATDVWICIYLCVFVCMCVCVGVYVGM